MAEHDETNPDVGEQHPKGEEGTTLDVVATVKVRERGTEGNQSTKPQPDTQKPSGWPEWIKTWTAVAALIVATFALTLNYKALRASQRAWVLFDNEGENLLTEEGADLWIRNFGHSPASRVLMRAAIVFDGSMPTPFRISVGDPKIGPPVIELLLPPGRKIKVPVRWTPKVEAEQLDVTVTYEDGYSWRPYTHLFCVRPEKPGGRVLVECGWNHHAD